MKLKKIICLGFNGNEFEDSHLAQLDELSEKRVLVISESEAIENHSDADGLLVKLGTKVNKEFIDGLPKLKYIGMLGTGYGGIDAKYATTKGIVVTNIADYATEGVVEFTFGILIDQLRTITKAKSQAGSGNYSDEGYLGREIKNKKFGVIGLGNIGRRTAEIATAFGAKVTYWSRNQKSEIEAKGISYCEFDTLLSTSDIITINLARNSETENILNNIKINEIKSGAIVINPSPMELLDFNALVTRLKKNDITFILDHSDEMTKEQLDILKPLENCVIYPPIAYLTAEAASLKKQIYIDNIKNFLAGTPSNKVN